MKKTKRRSKAVEATVLLIVDRDGQYAAMGRSTANEPFNPKNTDDLFKLISEWNLGEDIGFCKAYKIKVKVNVPSLEEVQGVIDTMELGMIP